LNVAPAPPAEAVLGTATVPGSTVYNPTEIIVNVAIAPPPPKVATCT